MTWFHEKIEMEIKLISRKIAILSQHHSAVWKNDKFTLIEKNFVKSTCVISLLRPLFSRNFCQECVRVNFRNFYTVICMFRFTSLTNLASSWNIFELTNFQLNLHKNHWQTAISFTKKPWKLKLMNLHWETYFNLPELSCRCHESSFFLPLINLLIIDNLSIENISPDFSLDTLNRNFQSFWISFADKFFFFSRWQVYILIEV